LELLFYKIAALLFSLLIAVNAYCAKRIVGVWINPVSLFSLFWTLYTVLPLLVGWPLMINPLSVFYIYLVNLALLASLFLFDWKYALIANSNKPFAAKIFAHRYWTVAFSALGIVSPLMMLKGMGAQGFSLSSDMNLLEFAGTYANARYTSELEKNIFSQLGLLLAYPLAAIGGLLWPIKKGGTKFFIIAASFFPSLISMLLQSSKGHLFLSAAIFFGGVLITRLYDKKYTIFTTKAVYNTLRVLVILSPIVIISFLSRGLQNYSFEDALPIVGRYLAGYSSGHLYAFSDWFSDRYLNFSIQSYYQEDLTAGFYTFMSLFQLFGDERYVPLGIYDEFFQHDYMKTNIYTIFRGLLIDFGLVGSLLFVLVAGASVNFFFYRLLVDKRNSLAIALFIYFLAIAYQSYIISSLTFKVMPVSFVLLVMLLWLLFNLRRKFVVS